jgi:hypothetical protein
VELDSQPGTDRSSQEFQHSRSCTSRHKFEETVELEMMSRRKGS